MSNYIEPIAVNWEPSRNLTYHYPGAGGSSCGIELRHCDWQQGVVVLHPRNMRSFATMGIQIPIDRLDAVIEALMRYRDAYRALNNEAQAGGTR